MSEHKSGTSGPICLKILIGELGKTTGMSLACFYVEWVNFYMEKLLKVKTKRGLTVVVTMSNLGNAGFPS